MSSDLRTFYSDRYAQKDTTRLRSRAFKQAEHKRIARELIYGSGAPVGDGARILDIGSGGSFYLDGVSGDRFSLDLALRPLDGAEIGIQGSADALPFADLSFDTIVVSQVLEHVPDWLGVLAEISRTLRPGGRLVLTVPNRYALMRRRFHMVERLIDLSGHLHEFREAQLIFALRSQGLDVVSSQGACYDVFWLCAMLERSRYAWIGCAVLDRVGPDRIEQLMRLESVIRRHRLRGLSLEIIATRDS